MSANLNIASNGEAALYLLKEKAWHGLGQVVEEAKTSEEVIKLAHLDWSVAKTPNFIKVGDIYVPTGSVSTIRTDNNAILGNRLTTRYEIMQNSEAFKFMDSLVICDKDIVYETAGALGKGEITFVTAKLPGYIRIKGAKDDVIEKYFIMANSHDGSTPLSVFFSDIRPVCNNTLSAARLNCTNKVILRHTSSLHDRLDEGMKVIGLELAYAKELEEALNHLAKVRVDEKYIKDFVNGLFLTKEEMKALAEGKLTTRRDNLMQEVYAAINSAPGQNMYEGTALHLYNGVTSYFQNVKQYRSDSRKMMGINLGGEESLLTQKAFNTLLQLA